jgi:hypothetical protein
MPRKRMWCTAGLAAFALFVACTAYEPDDAPEESVDGSLDASPASDAPDAITPSDVFDGGSDDRLFHDGFETTFDCTNWVAGSVTLQRSDLARTGNGSCKLCLVATGLGGATRILVTDASAGAYQFETWTRHAAADAATVELTLVLRHPNDGGESAQASSWSTQTAVWQRSSIAISVEKPVNRAELRIILNGSNGDCVVMDDVALRHETRPAP